jgi:ABC-type glycerol-3-phosphate transport system substrate-binding protein
MRFPIFRQTLLATWALFVGLPMALHAAAAPALQKAKQESEAKGFIFETSRDEIIAKARKEGKLRVLTSLENESLKPVAEAFKKKYPFIDLRAEEIAGTDTYQRMLLEMKSGTASSWDVNYLTTDFISKSMR